MAHGFQLAYDAFGAEISSARRLWMVAHGVFGSARNWRSFLSALSALTPDDAICAVDLRAHGRSKAAPPPHMLLAAAKDLRVLAEHLGRNPDVLVGHSFGGKVVLNAALQAFDQPPLTLVLDAPIGASDPEEAPLASEVGRMINYLLERPMPVLRRSEVSEELTARGFSRGVAGWMATNLEADQQGAFRWHFDVVSVQRLLEDYWRQDFYAAVDARADLPLAFVVGSRSDRFNPKDLARLQDLAARTGRRVEILSDAAHWLHIDQPDALMRLLLDLVERPGRL